ncbi:(2Fe-2S)-binding protein [Bacillus sp. B15-48]|uniref:(2Fe-2S)-binding protein n=1 Tax=Bacillus sp. B15-48 TaxID=1548601 RepID=UPI00193FFE50|nr:(2Fe-2S)-binding protein [Bacillus sp. B15-48]MBM4761213.1 2Fe-2S iron-sulfur cluster binding domain-containing protein [Bacillus sp. B15-48]
MKTFDDKIVVKFTVNDREREVLTAPNKTLLEVLRSDLGLTGTKHGCDDSNCGVCTIIMNGNATKACCTLVGQAEGSEIVTIEGLETEEHGLHPLQKSFIETFAIQCGFCTPGMILSGKALLDENPNATEDDIREALHGNMCRCTGYKKITEAIEVARDEMNAVSSKEKISVNS